MNDNELFTLCKQVYEKTGWVNTENVFIKEWNDAGKNENGIKIKECTNKVVPTLSFAANNMTSPFYTSDYLLEKLPPKITGFYQYFSLKRLAGAYETPPWTATYGKGMKFYADTPLKALLKLTLALAEAGELK
jgi:hypothetical protein